MRNLIVWSGAGDEGVVWLSLTLLLWRWSTHAGHINRNSHVWNDRMAPCYVKEANHRSTNVRFHLYVTPRIGTVRETECRMVGAKGWGRRKWGVGIYWGQSFCLERWTSSRDGWWGWLLSIVNIQCHWIEHLEMIKMVKFTLCILYHNLKKSLKSEKKTKNKSHQSSLPWMRSREAHGLCGTI